MSFMSPFPFSLQFQLIPTTDRPIFLSFSIKKKNLKAVEEGNDFVKHFFKLLIKNVNIDFARADFQFFSVRLGRNGCAHS